MSSTADLIAPVGARRLALERLAQAETAYASMREEGGEEALHDFRVAVRRLRTHVRSWRPWLEDAVRGKDRRRLRDIGRATGNARDLDVQVAWLQRTALPAELRAAAQSLAGLHEAERGRATAQLEGALDEFERVARRLRRRATVWSVTVDVRRPYRVPPPTARVAADQAAVLASELRAGLSALADDESDVQIAHETRIRAKRLRYLLEPFADDVGAGNALIDVLKTLQDDLGEVHDRDVLIERIAAAPEAYDELQPLEEWLLVDRKRTMARARDRWLDDRGGKVCEQVDAFVSELRAFGPPPPEIERKFLLRRVPQRVRTRTAVERIEQGFLPGGIHERVRRVRNGDSTDYYRTVKAGRGVQRLELEEPIDSTLFKPLWRLTRGNRVSKRRYTYREGDSIWEIDRFLDRDLVIAEIELDSPDQPVDLPPWLAHLVVREVTGDPRFDNVELARNGGRVPRIDVD